MNNKFFNDDNFSVDTAATIVKQAQSAISSTIINEGSSLHLLTSTGQFYVIDIDDKYIIRFPKEAKLNDGKSQSLEELKAESEITESIFPYINKTQISNISVVDGQFPFAVHKKIKGDKLTKKDFAELTDEQKSLYANDLAVFLAELHAVPLDKVNLPNRKELNFDDTTEIQQTLNEYGLCLHQNTNQSQDLVCCHNDLHGGNVGVDLSKQHILQGVFDFGMCGVAKRSSDFYKIFGFDKKLCKEVVEQYNKLSPQKVDIRNVENQYLSWCAVNIKMARGKYPQIVSAMEEKLQDFRQYQLRNAKLDALRSKLGVRTVFSEKSTAEQRELAGATKISHQFQKTKALMPQKENDRYG